MVRDVAYCLVGLGVLFGAMGIFAFSQISPQAAPIRGIARNLVFGVPLLTLGGIQLLCGILFRVTGKTLFGAVGAVALAVIGVLALVLTGISLINGLLAAAPIFIAQRLSLIAKAKDDDKPA
jgi:hypothetical protein